jgi:hypothetical protein
MLKAGLILVAFIIAIATPWLIVKTDINTAPHTLPGGWQVWFFHSQVVVHSPQYRAWYFSLKDVFVRAAILILIGLAILAAIRERQRAARGFQILQEENGTPESSTDVSKPTAS